MRHWFKLFIVTACVLGAYMIYLDAQVQKRFEGNKWQVPAQIYARPLVISLDQEISLSEVKDELDLLGYRRDPSPQGSGEYSAYRNRAIIQRRAFHFPDGDEPQRHIQIDWRDGRIAALTDKSSGESLRQVKLEPWLVARLVSGLEEDRMLIDRTLVPDMLRKALVTVEDKNFYQHWGVAPLSIARALIANITAGRTVQGGSTLTQQLAKNFFLSRERSYTRKAKEALMALIIDFRYSKEAILNAYINEVFLGQNGAVAVHGFGLASHFYFDKPINELTIPEIATLVGMVKGPSYYHPRRHPERTLTRRNLVLRMLLEDEHISRQQYQAYVTSSLSPVDSESLASGKHPAFMQKVRQELTTIIDEPEARLAGVKVFTTLDINAQRRAENALKQTVSKISAQRKKPKLDAAMMVSDISSGGIRAIVGGKNIEFDGFNRALDAYRPIGSLVKPAVYLTALEMPDLYNLASPIEDTPITMKSSGGRLWEPMNADKTFRGKVSMLDAIVRSYNVPSVKLGMQLGLDEVAYTLRRLGISANIPKVPALTLGAVELSVLDVNQMYQTIANNGVLQALHSVTAVSTHDDVLLWQREADPQRRTDESATYLLNYALHKVTLEGTGKQIKQGFSTVNMAGKTGTTNDYRDSWFAGFDRNLVSSIWMGADDNSSVGLSGASGAMQVFLAFQRLQTPKSLSRRFPSSLAIAHFDADSGKLSAPGCGNIISVPAIVSSLPATAQPCAGQAPITPLPEKKKTFWERLFGN